MGWPRARWQGKAAAGSLDDVAASSFGVALAEGTVRSFPSSVDGRAGRVDGGEQVGGGVNIQHHVVARLPMGWGVFLGPSVAHLFFHCFAHGPFTAAGIDYHTIPSSDCAGNHVKYAASHCRA